MAMGDDQGQVRCLVSGPSLCPSYVRFVNKTNRHVDVIWLNYEGLRIKYKSLGPNQTCSNEDSTSIKQHTPRTKQKLLPATRPLCGLWLLLQESMPSTGAPMYTNRKRLEPNLQGFYTMNKKAQAEEFGYQVCRGLCQD
ncbi:uncharacterized protein Vhl isoform X5 [Dermacentor andersoni]|uniref:uncharacterized protein Vhl isoform X5 n=1 Tax=Dermacentor andersoni TaxID=34620 RepID=UPI003B3BCC95